MTTVNQNCQNMPLLFDSYLGRFLCTVIIDLKSMSLHSMSVT